MFLLIRSLLPLGEGPGMRGLAQGERPGVRGYQIILTPFISIIYKNTFTEKIFSITNTPISNKLFYRIYHLVTEVITWRGLPIPNSPDY